MERFPISIRLTGVLHKEKTKMYITSVLWSDQNDIVVYRSFDEFREMHKKLKKTFLPGNKVNKSDRILPKFQSNKVKQKSQGKGSSKSLVRLKYLQKYCNELLSCDQRVSQSADLVKFLQPMEKELKPEFTKNCIMIMPSKDELMSSGGHNASGNVTQPFVTETYRCVAPYETKDTKNKPFKAAMDEMLDVLIKDKAGWWLVENEEKRMAWFPAPYLDKLDDDDEEEVEEIPQRGMFYIAVKGYSTTAADEVSVNIGTVVEVLRQPDDGWWLIRHNGKTGYIPSLNLQPSVHPHIQMMPQHNVQSPSSFLAPSNPINQHHRRSYGNLPQLPNSRPASPSLIPAESIHRSQSLNRLSEEPYARPVARPRKHLTTSTPVAPVPIPLPVITVQSDEEGEQNGRMLRDESVDSFESDSFSDDSLSGANDEQPRLCPTPSTTVTSHLSPTTQSEGTLLPSVSDPNLYKGPKSPKVPPRPRAQEILTRCSTVTRKNAAKSNLSPTSTEVTGR